MFKEGIDKRDGTIILYIDRKCTISKHRYLYQEYHNCKLTNNEVVIFLDGNNRNFDINNLYKLSRGELVMLNRWYGVSSDPQQTLNYIDLIRLRMKRVEVADKAGLTDARGNIKSDMSEAGKKYRKVHRKEINAYMREYRKRKRLI